MRFETETSTLEREELLKGLLREARAADHLARRRFGAESVRLYEHVAERLSSSSEAASRAVSSVPPPDHADALTQANVLRASIAAGLRSSYPELVSAGEEMETSLRRFVRVLVLALAVFALFQTRAYWAYRDLAPTSRWTASSHIDGAKESGVFPAPAAFDDVPNYFFHTRAEKRPHLDVDLGRSRSLLAVRITNRIDCCTDRGKDLEVWLGNDGVHFTRAVQRPPGDDSRSWTAWLGGQSARYVRIELPRKDNLHLARVRIFGR